MMGWRFSLDEEARNVYKILVGKPFEKKNGNFEDQQVNWRIILRWILEKEF
jgi:hypothetical protein